MKDTVCEPEGDIEDAEEVRQSMVTWCQSGVWSRHLDAPHQPGNSNTSRPEQARTGWSRPSPLLHERSLYHLSRRRRPGTAWDTTKLGYFLVKSSAPVRTFKVDGDATEMFQHS